MAELFKEEGHKLISIRGMPRVGKTESIVAGSVCAHKRWLFISSTLIKQTVEVHSSKVNMIRIMFILLMAPLLRVNQVKNIKI